MTKKIFILLIFICFISHFALPADKIQLKESTAPFWEYVQAKGYPFESHDVITRDGYIITLFRIQTHGQNVIAGGRRPVLLLHGISDTADLFVMNSDNLSLAFRLANVGFDVWLGNNRGSRYSRNHTILNPDKDKDYWQFSFQEMAKFDLPAMFSHVSAVTRQRKINFIGHSQGATQLLAALSEKEYIISNLLDKTIIIAPSVILYHTTSAAYKLLTKRMLPLYGYIEKLYSEHNTFGSKLAGVKSWLCKVFPRVCGTVQTFASDANLNNFNLERYHVYVGHHPGGTSMRCSAHLAQFITDDKMRFRKFDFGKKNNLLYYGHEEPPVYNLTNVNNKIHLFLGLDDRYVVPEDGARVLAQLKNGASKFYREGHYSFFLGKKDDHIYDILQILNE